jgi:cytoskeletal protein CcmA (bactofilin family)
MSDQKIMNQNDIQVSGVMKAPSDLEARQVLVEGMFRVNGNLTAQKVIANGMMNVNGNLCADELEMNGLLKVEKQIKSQTLKGTGMLKAARMDADEIQFDGKLTIRDVINCESFHFTIDATSFIGEIEASQVVVSLKKSYRRKKLKVNALSADLIHIDGISCKEITGDQLVIGPHCVIDLIEYKTSCDVHPKAKVNTIKQI